MARVMHVSHGPGFDHVEVRLENQEYFTVRAPSGSLVIGHWLRDRDAYAIRDLNREGHLPSVVSIQVALRAAVQVRPSYVETAEGTIGQPPQGTYARPGTYTEFGMPFTDQTLQGFTRQEALVLPQGSTAQTPDGRHLIMGPKGWEPRYPETPEPRPEAFWEALDD
jgi:hypothetical protein